MWRTSFLILLLAFAASAATPVTATVVNTWYSYVDGKLVSQLTTTVGSFARNTKGHEVLVTPSSRTLKRGGKTFSLLPRSKQYIGLAPRVSSTLLQSTAVLRRLFTFKPGTGEIINGIDCISIPFRANTHGLNGVGKMWVSPDYELQIKIETEWTSKGQLVGRDVMEMTNIKIGVEPDVSMFSIPPDYRQVGK